MFLIFINPKNIIIIIYNKSFDTMVVMFLLIYTLTENIALHKQAHQMYRYTGLSVALTEASNAVDGLKSNLSVWGEQCVISGEADRHLVGKLDKHPQHPPRYDLLQDRECALGVSYISFIANFRNIQNKILIRKKYVLT